jgi:hypothetical protein
VPEPVLEAVPGRGRAAGAGGVLRGLAAGIALAALIASCVVHQLMGPRLTGTCKGACEHYLACKPGAGNADRDRCWEECPEVFGDRDSLVGFESLSCADAVEYVDGTQKKIAKPR